MNAAQMVPGINFIIIKKATIDKDFNRARRLILKI